MNSEQPHAYIDESMRDPQGDTQSGIYIVTGVIQDPQRLVESRAQMRLLLPNGRSRLHWHQEAEGRKRAIAETISTLDVLNLVVVNTRYDPKRQERARRKCLERMLGELKSLGVTRAVLESRSESLNRKDVEMFAALRSRGQLTRLRAGSGRSSEEPMLWIADAVSGAVNGFLSGVNPAPFTIMESNICVLHVDH